MKTQGYRWGAWLGILGFAVFLHSGCTREMTGDSSVVLSIPKAVQGKIGAQATSGELSHIVVNIKGPGMSPLIWHWDSEDSSGVASSPPASIELAVPSGDSRVIQYLGVYETSSGAMQFTYGDVMQRLSAGGNHVKITAYAFGSSTNEGQLVGRYLTGVETGPTGHVIGSIQPPATASSLPSPPPMEIFEQAIYSGWFKFMVFDGDARFTYKMTDGTVLFNNVSLSDSALTPSVGANSKLMRVNVPMVYRSHDGTVSNMEKQPETDIVYGFFGPGSTAMNICHENSGDVIEAFYSAPTDVEGDDIIDGNPDVSWAGTTTCTAGAICVTGGGDTSCGSTLWADYIKFDPMSLDQGSDGRLMISGAFQGTIVNGGLEYVSVTTEATSITASWNLLPGILEDANSINGISVFLSYESTNDDLYKDGDDLPCDIAAQNVGYTHFTDVVKTTNSIDVTGLTSSQVDNATVLLCPYKNTDEGRKYFSGDIVRSHGSVPL